MLLELDIGNTRTKWRILGTDSRGFFPNDRVVLPEIIHQVRVRRVRGACVAGPAVQKSICELITGCCAVNLELAVSGLYCGGLLNAYATPLALGVDRWLAAVAAWHGTHNACMVVDAGSALTIDYIDNRGVYRGGYIIPGLKMMQASLCSGTGQITIDDVPELVDDDINVIPINTVQAVRRGAESTLLATTEKHAAMFLEKWPAGSVIITGGDGPLIASRLGLPNAYVADLVMDGLQFSLP